MASSLIRALPLLRLRLAQGSYHLSLINGPTPRRPLSTSAADSTSGDGDKSPSLSQIFESPAVDSTGDDDDKSPSLSQIFRSTNIKPPRCPQVNELDSRPKVNELDSGLWKEKEAEIFQDIDPIVCLTKEILHSNRYFDGQRLTPEDEKAVVENLLVYHPHSEDKIGCGLDSIMVDRHPQFAQSRCLFVVRTDGGWIDFSYQKCLKAYIREKYPSYGEKFVKEYFKR